MEDDEVIVTIITRGGTTAEWEIANPIPKDRELCVEATVDGKRKFKIGDGATAWKDLPYAATDELADLAQDATHRVVTDSEKATWNAKQGALTFDDAPAAGSNNPVKSSGIKTALDAKANVADLATIAKSGKLSDATEDATHRVVTDSEKAAWNAKQDALTFDTTPTASSSNPVTSEGVKTYVDRQVKIATEYISDAAVTKEIEPNKVYIFTSDAATSLNITLQTPTDYTKENKYQFFFNSGNPPTTVTLPTGIYWETEPIIITDTKYEVVIYAIGTSASDVTYRGKIIPYYKDNDYVKIVDFHTEEATDGYVLTDIDYAELIINVSIPIAKDASAADNYRVNVGLSNTRSGYCGTATPDSNHDAVYICDVRMTTKDYAFTRLQGMHKQLYTSGSGRSWLALVEMKSGVVNQSLTERFRNIYIFMGDAMNGTSKLPANTYITIYGKKY